MSLCLHFCEQYKVRHSQSLLQLRNDTEVINNLLYWLASRCEHANYMWYSEDDISYSNYIEWDKEGVRMALDELEPVIHWDDIPEEEEGITGDWSMQRWLRDSLIEAEHEANFTPARFSNFLLKALRNSEPSLDYIRFEWI